MMNSHEAIKGLDGYSETLISLSVLLGSQMFEDKTDEQARGYYDRLLILLREAQRDGKSIALKIIEDSHRVGTKPPDKSDDLTGISAAMQRYVLADKQASEALNKKEGGTAPNSVSEAIRRFREKTGFLENG
jgi:hypothetical protein